MTSTEEQIRTVVARQAADWFIANQGAMPDHAERAAFVAWLRASPIHIEEYLGVALVARDLPAAADDPEISLESLLELARADAAGNVVPVPALYRREPAARRVPLPRRWSLAGAAAAAVAILAMSVFWWTTADQSGNLVQTYRTAHGEQAQQRLPDGSVLHLNTETAVAVNYDRGERVVHIEGGQALFKVAHDDSRQFRVVAGGAEIVATGTQFDVRLVGETAVVTVVEGQVDVYAGTRRRVEAGYQLRIDGGVMPAQSERIDVQAAVAWLQRKIVFERRPLGEVADEFNRYGTVQFTIDDAALRALAVSGIFGAYDTKSFAAFLETLDGVRVERTPTQIHVVKSEHTKPGKGPAVN
jgi:transmembrane sensor